MNSLRSLIILAALGVCLLPGCKKASPKKAAQSAPASDYKFGEVISFGRNGRSDTFKGGGWGETQAELTWTNGDSARVTVVTPDSEKPLRLRMRLSGFINPPWLPFQPVEVFVNDEKVADWEVSDEADYVAMIPPSIANHVRQMIELRMPQATSPKVLRLSNDARTLGVCCYEMAITEEDSSAKIPNLEAEEALRTRKDYALGTVINFGAGGGAQRYKVSGWYNPEKNYTWMGKEPAVLDIVMPPTDRALTLKMKLTGMFKPESLPNQLTEISANGAKIAEWTVADEDEFEATIPANIVGQRRRLRIEIRTPNAISPKDLGVGDETRVLGVRCDAMMITDGSAGSGSLISDPSPSPSPSPTTR